MPNSKKWVKVMADFAANGVWRSDGVMFTLDNLPVSHNTIFMLGQWQQWFESRHSEADIPEAERFVAYGWKIVWEIIRQLPDWTVIYFDELALDKHQQRVGPEMIGVRLWLR